VPWLIIHGAADEAVSPLEGEALRAAGPREITAFLEIPGAGHTFGAAHPWKGITPELEQAVDASMAHLSSALV
jgi:pimeloyl-ACP methyl ester carboxylesterase